MSNEIITGRDVLRLLAEGVSIHDFEYRTSAATSWQQASPHWYVEQLRLANGQFRRKPKMRVINGFTVPEPARENLHKGQEFFLAYPTNMSWYMRDMWCGAEIDRVRLQRGLIFYDREAAIATAKAMCGIDPNKEN